MKKQEKQCDFCGQTILRIPTKSGTHFCNNDCKGKWQVAQREKLGFNKEWLIDQYFNQGKDCNQIGREIGRDGKSVWNWLKWYGVKIKGRGGESSSGSFQIGHKKGVGRVHNDETKEKIRQARKRDGRVPYLRDGKHWLHHDGAVSPMWKGGITPERQGVYSSKEWCESVKIVWKRDNATCQICKKHQSRSRETKFHIHHIESFIVKDKRTDPDNLVLLCPDCHKFVHSKRNVENVFIKIESEK